MSIIEVGSNAADAGFSAAVVLLVTEVAHARKDHRDASLVSGRNHFIVTHRTTWLDHCGDANLRSIVDAITEREERI